MTSRPTVESYSRTTRSRYWNGFGYSAESFGTLTYLYREQHGSKLANYRYLKARRQLPALAYSATGYRIGTTNHQGYQFDGLGRLTSASDEPYWPFGGAMPFSSLPPTMVAETENKTFQRFAKQLSSVRVNLAEFFGERRQTANMLATTAMRVAKGALALKNADLKAFTQALSFTGSGTRQVAREWRRVEKLPAWKRIPDLWLEYVYGWKPLLSDIFEATEMLKDYAGTHPYHGRVQATSSRTLKVSVISPRSGLGHICYDKAFTHTARVTAFAYYTCESQLSSVLAQTGITNPALLVWELTPYSFVVDWFYPVGNYLESLTAFDGFTLTGGFVSTLVRSTMAGSSFGYNLSPNERYVGGSCWANQWSFERSLRLPSTTTMVKSPLGGEPLSRFATAMSLLVQLFKPK